MMGNWRHESIKGRMLHIKEGFDQAVGTFRAGDPGHTCLGNFWADAELALEVLADAEEEITRLELEVAHLECERNNGGETFFSDCAARDESRDEQPPFASRTPSGIEVTL